MVRGWRCWSCRRWARERWRSSPARNTTPSRGASLVRSSSCIPASSLRAQGELLRALQLAKQGDLSRALALLAPLRNNHTNAGRQAIAQSFRLRGEWTNLVGWVRSELPLPVRRNDLALMPLYLRGLGETGARDELLLEFANTLTDTQAALSAGLELSVLILHGRSRLLRTSRPARRTCQDPQVTPGASGVLARNE